MQCKKRLDSGVSARYAVIMQTMTLTEVREAIRSKLSSWHSSGEVATSLGLTRSAVAGEIARMDDRGLLESRVQRFYRGGDYRLGRAYQLVGIVCEMPAPGSPDERRNGLLAALFECEHGIMMCEPCSKRGRRCGHRCLECAPEQVFAEAR